VLVEEQQGLRDAVQGYLLEHGFSCDTFASAGEAMGAMTAAAALPDAIVTDPGDGLTLLRAVRCDARLCAVPVVLLTARALTADRVAGFDAGASAFISKPFDPAELVSVLHAVTSNALLARAATQAHELRELREDVAAMRQMVQMMLQVQAAQGLGTGGGLGGDSDSVAAQLAAGLPGQGPQAAELPQLGPAAGTLAQRPSLTVRELSVLELVGNGMQNKEIATALGFGLRWVEKIVRRLLTKTGTTNRTELVRRSLQIGLITDPMLQPTPAARAAAAAAAWVTPHGAGAGGARRAEGGRGPEAESEAERSQKPEESPTSDRSASQTTKSGPRSGSRAA
jgi:DNA-binding NarL/FixJ family response regulator